MMDRCEEVEEVMKRMDQVLEIAEEKNNAKEARTYSLWCKFNSYKRTLIRLLGMIYSLVDKYDRANEQFEKYKELSPKKFEVDRYFLVKDEILGLDES